MGGRSRLLLPVCIALCCYIRWLPAFFVSARRWPRRPVRRLGGRRAAEDNLLGLDEATVSLHKKYHEATITYTAMNIDWAQHKGYENDGGLNPEEQLAVAAAARSRLFRWPALDPQDLHEVRFGPDRHRFCPSADSAEALGDPGENVFVISQMRRPSRLRHALHELYREGISAKIVDAVDGDGFRSQDEMEKPRLPGLSPAESELLEAILAVAEKDKKATLARPSVVRSLVAGVKSFSSLLKVKVLILFDVHVLWQMPPNSSGAGLLGVVFRPLSRKAPAAELRVPENTFYFDPAQRWRQQGMEDVDTSNIDPATGRQKQLNLSAMELPPMGPPPTAPAACSRQGPASLYVDPLAPPRAAAPAPAPMKPQQFVAPPVEHGQGKVAIHAATGDAKSRLQRRRRKCNAWNAWPSPLAPDAVAAPEPAPEPMVRVASPGHGPCGPGDGSLVPSALAAAMSGQKLQRSMKMAVYGGLSWLSIAGLAQLRCHRAWSGGAWLGILPVPGYVGHKNHGIHLTTGEVGCFMSHFTIWHHMVQHQLPAALILEDDFDLQPDFASKLGSYLEEARGYDWNLMYVGRSPTEADWSRLSDHVVEPGYTLWTVGRPS
eukprot:s1700_g2.t2